MVASSNRSRKKKQTPVPGRNSKKMSNNLRSLRANLMSKNEKESPAKHKMCWKIFLAYLQEKHPDLPVPSGVYPKGRRVFNDTLFAGCLDWYWSQSSSTQAVMRLLHGYLGRTLLLKGKNWTSFPLSEQTYKRVKADKKFSEYKTKKVQTLTPSEDLRIGLLGFKTVRLATCQFILLLGM